MVRLAVLVRISLKELDFCRPLSFIVKRLLAKRLNRNKFFNLLLLF